MQCCLQARHARMVGRSRLCIGPRTLLLVAICFHTAAAAAGYRILLADASVTSTTADGDATTEALTFPQLLRETLLLTPETDVTVALTLRDAGSGQPVAPQQVMVRATHEAGGQQAFFVARGVADGAAGAWSAVITSQALAKQMGPVGGRAALALVVGDVDVDNPIEYNFAQMEVTLSAADRAVAPTRAASGGVKPEILHQHRKPDKRPPAAIAYAFAGLVVAELAALLLALSRHPAVNFAAWPKAGSRAAVACVAFHVGMAAVMGLYLVFWVQLSILQLLVPLAALGLFTVIAGHQALSALARERVKSA